MRRFFSAMICALLVFLLTGCVQVAPSQPSGRPPTSAETTAAAPALKPSATAPPSSPSITSVPKSSAAPPLALKVTSPQDDSIVNIASIPVIGQTTPGAVVSVNGNLADVDAVGKFQKAVMLDEGTNVIQVVASDENGTELNVILLVIYEP